MFNVDEFLDKIYDKELSSDYKGLLVFDVFDKLIRKKEFSICDKILFCVDVKNLDTKLMRSFLAITFFAKDYLLSRKELYDKIEKEMGIRSEKVIGKLK